MKKIIHSILFLVILHNVLLSQTNDEWQTYFEKLNYLKTPLYEETMEYFKKLAGHSDYAEMLTFGVSPQGRDLKCLIVSKDKTFTPEECKVSGKPIILNINGIHSGEIEGKDASMMLLREILITKEKEWMIDNVILLVIPIFSVDGHERFGKYNRINQNGPEEMGWRTTAQNLNLNRDWMKADAPEMKAMLKLFSDWLPDFIIDNHTTNGADYQYTITFGIEYFQSHYPEMENFIKTDFTPYLHNKMNEAGFLSYRYVAMKEWNKGLESGIVDAPALPRFSTGYAALQNRPALLVETHMLKPFKERVFATKATIEAVIEFFSENGKRLIEINRRSDNSSFSKIPLQFKLSDKSITVPFKGIKSYKEKSEISGAEKIVFTGEKTDMEVKLFNDVKVTKEVSLPRFYIIPAEWSFIIGRMKLHGIVIDTLKEEKIFNVKRYRFTDVKLSQTSYEGRQRVSFTQNEYYEKIKVYAGSFLINTKQRVAKVIVHLLEPEGDDSFIKWGFFNSIFEQKEYFESYVMENIAEEMIKENPHLLREFEEKLSSDEKFRNDPYARLNFFYERSPYYDSQLNVYPVMRVE